MWYDLVVLGILLFFTIRGAMRGVIWQLAGIAGILLCFFFAQSISAAVGPRINLQPPLNHWVVLFGSYLFFSFIAFGMARLLNDWVEKAQLKEFNRHLGAVFGLVKGVVLCLVMTFMLVTVSESAREALKDSRSGRYAAIIMDRLHPLMPEKLHDALAKYIHRLDSPDLNLEHSDHAHDEVVPSSFDPFAPNLGLPSAADTGLAANLGQPGAAPAVNPWTGLPQQSQQPVQPQQPQNAPGDFWSQLRNSLGTDVQNLVINNLTTTDPSLQGQVQNQLAEILRRTPPEQLPALRQQLLQPGRQMDQVLAQWLQASQPASGGPSTIPATPVSQPAQPATAVDVRAKMLRDISGMMSSIPTVRSGIEQTLNQWLASVPEPVANGVLQDMYTDLRGGGGDPDPQTNVRSSIEQRILRQMQINQVPLNVLSPQLQDRLRSAQAAFGSPL